MNQDALKEAISKEIERLLKKDDTISCTKRIDPLSIAANIDEWKCVNESPTSINGYSLNLPHQEHQTYHFMLSNHSGDAATNTTEICKGKRDNHLDTKNQATIFEFCQRTGTIEGIYHYFLKILLDAQNQDGRNWKCNYCHKSDFKTIAHLNTENVERIDQDFSSQLGQNYSSKFFQCNCCGNFCRYEIGLFIVIKNPSFGKLLKARMLWEAYFQEIPDEDFISGSIAKWKQSSLNPNNLIFIAKNRIPLEDAVRIIFNKDGLNSPAWNKRYLNAFQQWIIDFPHEDHQLLLINSALEIGIEHVRYHSNFETFFSQGRSYILIEERKIVHTDIASNGESNLRANAKKRAFEEDEETFTDHKLVSDEDVNLVRGINFIGMGKWNQIAQDPGLSFSNNVTGRKLKKRAVVLETKLKTINYSGKSYRVIPGYELQCIEPISYKKHLHPVLDNANIPETKTQAEICPSPDPSSSLFEENVCKPFEGENQNDILTPALLNEKYSPDNLDYSTSSNDSNCFTDPSNIYSQPIREIYKAFPNTNYRVNVLDQFINENSDNLTIEALLHETVMTTGSVTVNAITFHALPLLCIHYIRCLLF